MSKGPLVTDGDLKAAASATAFAADAIERHMSSEMYRNAVTANEYYRQHNVTINRFVQKIYSCSGAEAEDFTASKLRLASNLFKRLNVQRCTYSLGKGVSFVDVTAGGKDTTKEGLGDRFDDDVMEMGLKALIHGVSFPFWNLDHIDVFTADEFCPVWDEYSGALYAGVRFWRLDSDHPWHATLYEQDGYTEMVSGGSGFDFEVAEAKRAYKVTYREIPADGMKLAVDAENYSRLPIVAVWGSDAHQSTLVGMRESIDAYDLIKSGLVNDTRDCAQIYWLINGAGGMDDRDLDLWRAKLKLTHVAEVDAEQGQSVTPYTQEVPVEGRKETLAQIKADIYEDFGALDVHTIAAGATNDHIDAAYQPMDEEAAEFERHIREGIMDILALQGIEDTPVFTRTRISNTKEQVETVCLEAEYLDDETILRKLPNITPDERAKILERKQREQEERMAALPPALAANAKGAKEDNDDEDDEDEEGDE